MLWIDVTILVIVGFSALVSLLRGLVREALSLVAWIAAFWIAFTFSDDMGFLLTSWISDPMMNKLVSFAALFFITLFVGGLINYFVGLLIKKTGLTGTDRVSGVVFGILRGVVVVSLLLMMAGYTTLPQSDWWEKSLLIRHFNPIVSWMKTEVNAKLPVEEPLNPQTP